MSLQLYDSRRKQVVPFVPLEQGQVSAYVCGITPNNATHLGHAFTYVQFDVLRRLLTLSGYRVTYLQNATDINDSDDVIAQAKQKGMTWEQLADHWVKHFHVQMDALGVERPTTYMYATSAMQQIISMIQTLLDEKFAYVVDGMVYFDITRDSQYGQLSNLTQEQMIDISRQRGGDPDDSRKKHPLDFVLWFASEDAPNWTAPWGMGRPGWHIECSAMIRQVLGDQIDIHGGGADLMYPHHESEIAQSEAVTGKKPYVGYWMHVAMVRYEGEKMSKSLGNLVLVEDVIRDYGAKALRFLLLSRHYRDSWQYTTARIQEAAAAWAHIESQLSKADHGDYDEVVKALEDDLHTDHALSLLSTMAGRPLALALDLLGFLD